MLQNPPTTLIYAADPMCSWCYAFEPELVEIVESTGLPVRIVMGGLFVGNRTRLLDDGLRSYLHETWSRVAAASGQPVDFDQLDRASWTYDTEPACQAVVAARKVDPAVALDFFRSLQRAFYGSSIDLTDRAVYAPLAERVGLDGATFARALTDPALSGATRADFAEAARFGARGFPTLLVDTGAEQVTVSAGYNRASKVIRSIRAFL